jgi:AcrR family transcriptional regulator
MRAKGKTDYHHGDLRRALIDAAVTAIAKHGIDALNLRQLASRAGVSPGAPYHHFANREQLLRAIAEQGFERLEAELIAAREAAGAEAGARLEALGRAYIEFAVSRTGYFRVMFHGDAQSSGPTEPGLRAFHLLRDAVLACQEAGTAPPGDPGALVLTAWSAVHGFATLWVDGALPFEGMRPELMGAELGRLLARMFAALARVPARHGKSRLDRAGVLPASSSRPRARRDRAIQGGGKGG